ncbi:MAG: ribosomal protein S18-alanine N-acetyltransferase [Pseudomonadota bacterium]
MSSVISMSRKVLPQDAVLYFERIQTSDLAEVIAIENIVYTHPWTRGNFLDSLANNYEAWLVRDEKRQLIGYFLVLLAIDEAHLLNVSVRGDLHGQGYGCFLLDKIAEVAREHKMSTILLEVRPSNQRALSVYETYGFTQIGRRKAYYPAAENGREDAIVMRFAL